MEPPADRPSGGSIRDILSLPSLELGGLAHVGILKLALDRLFCDLDDLIVGPPDATLSRLILSDPKLVYDGI